MTMQREPSKKSYYESSASNPGSIISMPRISPNTLRTSALEHPSARDDQIVNAVLIEFLKAISITRERHADWSLHRKIFKFKSRTTKSEFQACIDGHLGLHKDGTSAAIVEVKARLCRAEPDHKIEMQESVLWHCGYWKSPITFGYPSIPKRISCSKSPDASDLRCTAYRNSRILISQDRHQI